MEYNQWCYKPDDVRKLILERCITAAEGLEMLINLERENQERILSFSFLIMGGLSFNNTLTFYQPSLYQLQ